MIEFLVTGLLVLLALYFLVPFLGSLPVFVMNFVLLALLAFRIPGDIKKRRMYPYYIISTVITSIIFILSNTKVMAPLFDLFNELLLLNATLAVLMIYLLSHLVSFIHDNLVKKARSAKNEKFKKGRQKVTS